MDREALTKGDRSVSFAPAGASVGGCPDDLPPGAAPLDADAEMGGVEHGADKSARQPVWRRGCRRWWCAHACVAPSRRLLGPTGGLA